MMITGIFIVPQDWRLAQSAILQSFAPGFLAGLYPGYLDVNVA